MSFTLVTQFSLQTPKLYQLLAPHARIFRLLVSSGEPELEKMVDGKKEPDTRPHYE